MERFEVAERVKNVTKTILKIDGDVDDNSNFIFDLGADSLQSVQLVAAFEEEFDIEMDEEKALQVKNVKNAIDFISKILET